MGGLRISVLSIKGGAGKSTIALTTALELTEIGRNVLLIDRDLLGYSSQLAGIRGKGLLASVVEGGNGGNYIVKKRRFTGVGVVIGRFRVSLRGRC
jgi:ATPases involved in chromosome partitioning